MPDALGFGWQPVSGKCEVAVCPLCSSVDPKDVVAAVQAILDRQESAFPHDVFPWTRDADFLRRIVES